MLPAGAASRRSQQEQPAGAASRRGVECEVGHDIITPNWDGKKLIGVIADGTLLGVWRARSVRATKVLFL